MNYLKLLFFLFFFLSTKGIAQVKEYFDIEKYLSSHLESELNKPLVKIENKAPTKLKVTKCLIQYDTESKQSINLKNSILKLSVYSKNINDQLCYFVENDNINFAFETEQIANKYKEIFNLFISICRDEISTLSTEELIFIKNLVDEKDILIESLEGSFIGSITDFINENLVNPDGKASTVEVAFSVFANGQVVIKRTDGVNVSHKKEANRLISLTKGRWKIASQNGKQIATDYKQKIVFSKSKSQILETQEQGNDVAITAKPSEKSNANFDLITLTNGQTINAKIIKISKSEIVYKKVSNIVGPVFVLGSEEVEKILYENGEVENISPIQVKVLTDTFEKVNPKIKEPIIEVAKLEEVVVDKPNLPNVTNDSYQTKQVEPNSISDGGEDKMNKMQIDSDKATSKKQDEALEKKLKLEKGKEAQRLAKLEQQEKERAIEEGNLNYINDFRAALFSHLEDNDTGEKLNLFLSEKKLKLINRGKIKGGFGDYFEYDSLTIEYVNSAPIEIWLRFTTTSMFTFTKKYFTLSEVNYKISDIEKNTIIITTSIITAKFDSQTKQPIRYKVIAAEEAKNTEQGYKRAIELMEPHIDSLKPEWILKLANDYLKIKDATKAIKYYQKAIDADVYDAAYFLANMYKNGENVEKNEKEAMTYYGLIQPESIYYQEAQYTIALTLEKSENASVSSNYSNMLEAYKKAANAGNINSMSTLGEYYFRGNKIPKDWNEAKKWHKMACDKQVKSSCDFLAFILKAEQKKIE